MLIVAECLQNRLDGSIYRYSVDILEQPVIGFPRDMYLLTARVVSFYQPQTLSNDRETREGEMTPYLGGHKDVDRNNCSTIITPVNYSTV